MEPRHLYDRRSWLDIGNVVIRLGLGCLFVWSGLSKIQLPHSFLGDVYAYRLVSPVLGMFVAMVLPWLELLVGACLLSGVCVLGALLLCGGMAVVFTAFIASALHQGLNISCGCFGAGAAPIGYDTLLRALLILIASGLAYVAEWRSPWSRGVRAGSAEDLCATVS